MTEPLLEVGSLTVSYRSRRRRPTAPALRDVSLSLDPGETLGIVGESGSGKSTLGKAVLGLAPVVSGNIRWRGRDITSATARERRALSREIQVVFQDPYSSLNPHRTVGQSILETLAASGEEHSTDARSRAARLLTRVGLDPTAFDRYPRQFSGGQRQRIAIARAVLPGPSLIICDEVVSALDLSVQAQVINLLTDLQTDHELSYLFITHDLSVVRHLCRRVVVLEHGRLVEQGPTQRVLDHPEDPYTERLCLAAPVLDPDQQRTRREARRAAPAR
ncbi:ABC transporter ATP-binding protein [Streptomyces sp. VNUA24]|uniref:ABC transporter ATP-binding protein n=1 Tax=Streptomyces sp. VNUA24 TaxID=3031131 RepID=UPI0023B8774F|nr:ABC transporter ATP-binding protein [Streptomyces sp. VNUA24]WEH12877.1 ABC transporter ATP-binding protein [Streptomyces sp. VNUA24]